MGPILSFSRVKNLFSIQNPCLESLFKDSLARWQPLSKDFPKPLVVFVSALSLLFFLSTKYTNQLIVFVLRAFSDFVSTRWSFFSFQSNKSHPTLVFVYFSSLVFYQADTVFFMRCGSVSVSRLHQVVGRFFYIFHRTSVLFPSTDFFCLSS